MGVYRYRAITPNGVIVSNRIEESSRSGVIRRLKRNNLTPINITEQIAIGKTTKIQRKNVKDVKDIMKNVDTSSIITNRDRHKESYIQKINSALSKTEKITTRDIVIFTQNFYLLKMSTLWSFGRRNPFSKGFVRPNTTSSKVRLFIAIRAMNILLFGID